jgi:phage gp46-like protein
MADVALVWTPASGDADLVVEDDDLEADAGLHTALLLSLFTDRRAEDDDELPSEGGDRRGWWADELSEVDGDLFGSRLWLLDRSARRVDVIPLAEDAAREAVAWLVDDGVVERIDVTAELGGQLDLGLLVTVYRPAAGPTTFRFAHVWEAMA